MTQPQELINLAQHPIADFTGYAPSCREAFKVAGVLVLEDFLTARTTRALQKEAYALHHLAYYCRQNHNVYLLDPDPALPEEHSRNREQVSDKGCIPDDLIPKDSYLRAIYNWPTLRRFLEFILQEKKIYPYADTLSSININYYDGGQQLGWHFDNASFAITLMIQAPLAGGEFEYVQALRDSNNGTMNYSGVEEVLSGCKRAKTLRIGEGALVLFRGRDAIHRVAAVRGKRSRILATLSFNTRPGVKLSKLARLAFFGRVA